MMVTVEGKDVDIKKRIGEIVADRGVSRTKLAEQMGISPAYLASVINSPDKSVSSRLLKGFAKIDVNINWLITGTGEMYNGESWKDRAEKAESEIVALKLDMDRAHDLATNLYEQIKKGNIELHEYKKMRGHHEEN